MSLKAARGTKRVCQNCGAKFYDLNRTPPVCPICQSTFQLEQRAKAAPGNAQDEDEEDIIAAKPPAKVEIVSLDEVEAEEGELPDLEESDLVEIDEDAADIKDDETFIEVEDEDEGDDVSGLLSGARDDDEDS